MNTAGSGVGEPVCGSRACRWMMAAPASAASIEERAISSGVIGRVVRHAGRVDRAGDGATDDDLAGHGSLRVASRSPMCTPIARWARGGAAQVTERRRLGYMQTEVVPVAQQDRAQDS